MIPMIADSQLALDQHRDPCRRPEIGTVAVGEGSLEQQLHQAPALGRSQLGRASWRRADSQGVWSPSPPCPEPAQHGAGGASDPAPHFVQRQAGIAQSQGSPSAILQQIGTALEPGHSYSPWRPVYCILYAEVK